MDRRARCCALVAVLALLASRAATAEPVTPREIRQNLFATCWPTSRASWMVGELGRIFRTVDGGATWARQPVDTQRPFLALACVDDRTAWAAGKAGIVYGTTDGGATWRRADTGSPHHVFALAFPTAERGHGAGDFGAMVHTEDGGRSWTTDRVPTDVVLPESALDMGVEAGDVNLYAIAYGDPDHAWLVGEFGTILTSDDGGRHWRQQRAPVDSTFFGVFFLDADRGWIVGAEGVILRTVDGGRSWTPVPGPADRGLYDIVVQGERGWIVGDVGTVLRTSDGGDTWQREPVPVDLAARWLRDVALAPDGRGLAVGAEGLVFRLRGPRLERLARQQPGPPA